ncbi:MAG: CPXCG motif-containing cysteine-rich protein [Halieaceae bacterium]
MQLDSQKVHCPYCGESIEVLIDCSVEEQSYIEDCQVCCRPIDFQVTVDASGAALVRVTHENE